MSKLDLNVAYEIVAHPGDLHICICKEDGKESYMLMIMRGPGRNFETILEEPPSPGSYEQAVQAVRNLLKMARDQVMSELMRSEGQLAQHLNVGESGIDLTSILSETDIRHIVNLLRGKGPAPTYAYPKFSHARDPSYHPHPIQ